jgi:3-hydroxyisobutyrate dehydrogenase
MHEPLRIGWIGTGIMGAPMAGHLLDRGHTLTVYNRTATKADPLVDRGARRSASPAEAAVDADLVCLCVGDTPDVEHVLFGDDGVAAGLSRDRRVIVVDHSTISPTATRTFADRLAGHGYIDAPISGGDSGAKAGTLSIMCGGDAGDLELARRAFDCYGRTVTHCGPVGHGQLTKLVNQILVGGTLLAVSEAVAFARKAGLDPETTLAAVGGGAAASWQLDNLARKQFAGDFAPGFTIDFMQKDLRLVLEFAREKQIPLPMTAIVSQFFAACQAQGRGGEGTQAIIRALRASP